MKPMTISRRAALVTLCGAGATALWPNVEPAHAAADYMQPDANRLQSLAQKLAAIPRRRNYTALPMILTKPDQWDSEALDAVLAYDGPRQLFDTTRLKSGWINQIRNTLNAQIFSLQRPNFLCAAAPHGGAALALFTQNAWNKYKLAELTDGAFKENSLLGDPDFPASDVNNPGNTEGLYTDAGNFIPTLQKRGAVFLGCHNAVWELATALLKGGINPDKLSHDELAADLTNNLIPGAISTPGNEAMIGKFEESGFVYSYT
jgi:hypothetical protein